MGRFIPLPLWSPIIVATIPMFVLLALFALAFGAHITTEVYCIDGSECVVDDPDFPAHITTHVELGTCYLHCSPCSVETSCISEMFTEIDGLIFQTLYAPTTDAGATPDCTVDSIANANFSCGVCQDATDRFLPAPGISVKYSCKILNAEEIAEGLSDQTTQDAANNAFVSFIPPLTGNLEFGEPAVAENYVVIVIRMPFNAQLDADQEAAAIATLRQSLADSLGQDISYISIQLYYVGDVDGSFLYDAVVTISGVARMAASALLALVFIALFI